MEVVLMNDNEIIPTRASNRSAVLDLYSSIDICIDICGSYCNMRISSKKFLWIY